MKSVHGPLFDTEVTTFRLFAPDRAKVEVVLFDPRCVERARVPMERHGALHVARVPRLRRGTLYAFSPDGEGPFPDPGSRFQPFGVHGPSQLVDVASLRFEHSFSGVPLERMVIYEAHVGTATTEGTFRALIERLDQIRDLGATAIELMPIADFPGARNWGYDGVLWLAPSRAYGTPEDLAALVDAAHARGLAMLLDVVYNHFGPDGNYFGAWTPDYVTHTHKTPWGDALDYERDALRALALESATAWIRDYRFDGLRLDATHAIIDERAPHVIHEIATAAREAGAGRVVEVFAEDERNESALLRELGVDAVWADDFHHEVRRIVAGDDEAWFADFRGDLDELVRILERGWLYEGQPRANGTPRGTSAEGLPPQRFVHCIQNHDQIGNRACGDRLHHAIPLDRYRAAITLLLGSPFTPLLFMGQEIATDSPFAFFTDHTEPLGECVTAGRREEFARFRAFADPNERHRIPDPQAERTFVSSKIDWSAAERSPGREILELHRRLLSLRRELPTSCVVSRVGEELVSMRRGHILYVVGLRGGGRVRLDGDWRLELDTESRARLDGPMVELPGAGAVVLRARVS